MVLKLYGFPFSTCTRRVALVLKEKNVPYELVVVDLSKGEQKAPAFLERQPFGVVPYIVDDDGFELFESRAIARYIATKYATQGEPILPDPADMKATALFEQAASIELSYFDIYASGIAAEKVFKPRRGIEGNEALAAAYQTQLAAKLDAYDKILAKQKYLGGNTVTLADLFHLPYGTMLGTMGINFLEDESRPNLVRWWKDITARPAWQAIKDRA